MANTEFLIDLKVKINEIMTSKYEIQCIDRIPTKQDVTFGEKACSIDAACLFIDIRNSTGLLVKYAPSAIANVLKAFHYICTKILKYNSGEVRSINGDSILAMFDGPECCDDAVSAAFNIKYTLNLLIKPLFNNSEDFDYGIGIDFGKIFVAKVGLYGEFNNDLIWVGNTINQASKFGNNAKHPNNIFITNLVYQKLNDINKIRPIITSQRHHRLLMGIRQDFWRRNHPKLMGISSPVDKKVLGLPSMLTSSAPMSPRQLSTFLYYTDYERPIE